MQTTIRYTATLPNSQMETLRELVKEDKIASVNQGICEAVSEYIAALERENYAAQMRMASSDADFQSRTSSCQNAFEDVDNEGITSW